MLLLFLKKTSELTQSPTYPITVAWVTRPECQRHERKSQSRPKSRQLLKCHFPPPPPLPVVVQYVPKLFLNFFCDISTSTKIRMVMCFCCQKVETDYFLPACQCRIIYRKVLNSISRKLESSVRK